jgi:transposase InsO family protein
MEFYEEHGIKRQFSAARTPQQNGVVKRKNITITKDAHNHVEGFEVENFFLSTISIHKHSYIE